jgi:hypothetical protein
MTAPRLATTRPAALTGTIGQGGLNRVHDVALVQALLGARRDKRARPYLRDHVTGKYDQATANALMGYRMDMRDQNIRRPLARSGPLLNKLAQGQSLAVLVGTAKPYSYATMAEAGPIRGLKAKELSAERKVELMQVMKELTRDWGIAFDVEVTRAPGNSHAFVGRFTPRHFSLNNGRRLSPVMSNAIFRGIAKGLHDALAADLTARCVEAFGIKDPVDVRIQQGLKDELACVVRTELEGVEAFAQSLLATGRKLGLKLAVRFFEHYLGASGRSIEVSREEAFEFDLIRNAVQENIERFKQRNFIAPESSTPGSSAVEDITKNLSTRVAQFQDHWKIDFNFTVAGVARFIRAAISDPIDTASARVGPGESSLTSCGDFRLTRQGDRILVTGTITHVWTDDGYNFDPGESFHQEAQILEKHKKARPFKWEARWSDNVDGELQILGPDSRLGQFLDIKRRWVRFDLKPGSAPDLSCGSLI